MRPGVGNDPAQAAGRAAIDTTYRTMVKTALLNSLSKPAPPENCYERAQFNADQNRNPTAVVPLDSRILGGESNPTLEITEIICKYE